jgi:hypothetical protein
MKTAPAISRPPQDIYDDMDEMGLELYIIGYEKRRNEMEVFSHWYGRTHNPLIDWFNESYGDSDADGSFYFDLGTDEIRAVIKAVKEKGLVTDYGPEYIRKFTKALAWLEQPSTDRKIYFQVTHYNFLERK